MHILYNLADFIPEIDNDSYIFILKGQNMPQARHCLDQRIGAMME